MQPKSLSLHGLTSKKAEASETPNRTLTANTSEAFTVEALAFLAPMKSQLPQSAYLDDDGPGIAFVIAQDGRYQTLDRCIKLLVASNQMPLPYAPPMHIDPRCAEQVSPISAVVDDDS